MQIIIWHFTYIRVTGRGISASKYKPSQVGILNSLRALEISKGKVIKKDILRSGWP